MGETLIVKHKLKSYTCVIHKGRKGYILNNHLKEYESLTTEELGNVLRELAISITE